MPKIKHIRCSVSLGRSTVFRRCVSIDGDVYVLQQSLKAGTKCDDVTCSCADEPKKDVIACEPLSTDGTGRMHRVAHGINDVQLASYSPMLGEYCNCEYDISECPNLCSLTGYPINSFHQQPHRLICIVRCRQGVPASHFGHFFSLA